MRRVILAHFAVYGALVGLLLSRPSGFGEFGDPRIFGVVLVTIALGAGLLFSLVWIATIALLRRRSKATNEPRSMLVLVGPPLLLLAANGKFWFDQAMLLQP